ncbi:MAG: aldo/keto reductase [Planctomycetota bacterium]|nr:aldo/keto reductase [Planctomycetota bacterium]
MATMQPIGLGSTDLRVSPLCLGGNELGAGMSEERSFAVLDAFAEAGGNFIDSANIYAMWNPAGAGSSESCLGRWMESRGNRGRMVVATKVGVGYPAANGNPAVERGLRKALILGECDKSLRRLQVDCIDLYYAHADDRGTPLEETVEAFDALVRAGKVRQVAASNYAVWRLAEARAIARERGQALFCCVQQHYTFVRPRPGATFGPNIAATPDMLDYCGEQGVGLLAYSPLLKGAYTRPERRWRCTWAPAPNDVQYGGPDADARVAALEAVAREVGADAGQVVLAWMRHSRPAVIPIFGASSPEQVRHNVAGAGLALSAEQMRRLDASGVR